jgi:hypothetical protein
MGPITPNSRSGSSPRLSLPLFGWLAREGAGKASPSAPRLRLGISFTLACLKRGSTISLVLTGASLASAFAWDPSGFAKSTLGDCGGRRPNRSPATIDLMPARGFVAYGAGCAASSPRSPTPLVAQGSIGPNNATGAPVLPGPPPFRCHYSATMTYSIAGACGAHPQPRDATGWRADGVTRPSN